MRPPTFSPLLFVYYYITNIDIAMLLFFALLVFRGVVLHEDVHTTFGFIMVCSDILGMIK